MVLYDKIAGTFVSVDDFSLRAAPDYAADRFDYDPVTKTRIIDTTAKEIMEDNE